MIKTVEQFIIYVLNIVLYNKMIDFKSFASAYTKYMSMSVYPHICIVYFHLFEFKQ